jgi:hypothetical protein
MILTSPQFIFHVIRSSGKEPFLFITGIRLYSFNNSFTHFFLQHLTYFFVNFVNLFHKFHEINIIVQFNITPEVSEIGEMHLEGNVVPHMWYQHIKFDNGKVDLISITILSDIVYWYRPTYERDENTGRVLSIRKKFKADALQKSKKALADQFGLTERQVKDSLLRLESMELIVRDYRTLTTADGMKINNVLFIKVVPENIKKITFGERHTYDVSTSYPRRSNVIPPTPKRQTNTENTTKTTTDINTYAPSSDDAAEPGSFFKSNKSNITYNVRRSSVKKEADEIVNSKIKKQKIDKIPFKENILLTQVEFDKLSTQYGHQPTLEMIDILSNYKYSSGKKYVSDYHTIIGWVQKRYFEEKDKTSSKSKQSDKTLSCDSQEVEKRKKHVKEFVQDNSWLLLKQPANQGDYLQIGYDKLQWIDPQFYEKFECFMRKIMRPK